MIFFFTFASITLDLPVLVCVASDRICFLSTTPFSPICFLESSLDGWEQLLVP